MKKNLLLITVLCIFLAGLVVNAQDSKQDKMQSKLLNGMIKDIKKDAKKEAKKLTKEGFKIYPGMPKMETQLTQCYSNILSTGEDGQPIYIAAAAIANGQNNQGARFASIEGCKIEIAGYVTSKVAGLIKQKVANDQSAETQTIFKTIAASKTLIAANLEFVDPCFTAYKEKSKGNIDVAATLIYNRINAENIGKKIIKQELQKEIDKTEEELNELLGF